MVKTDGISAARSRELENLLAKPDRRSWGFIPGLRGVWKLSRGHGPGPCSGGSCRSEATIALYALPRIQSSTRSPSVSTIINVIFGNGKTENVPWWRIICSYNRSPAIKSRIVCDNNFRSIGVAYADYSIIVVTCPYPIKFIVYIRKSD